MSLIANGLVMAGILLAIMAAIQAIAARGWLPESSLLAIVGLLLGASYATLTRVAPQIGPSLDILVSPNLPAEAYLWIFLPPLLFQAALTADVRSMLPDAVPILVLAIVAVFIATGFIGWSLAAVSGRAIAVCLLLGAVVATTDPSAVITIFRDLGAPARLNRLVEGESLLNDAAAIAIVGVLIATIGGDADAIPASAVRMLALGFGGGIGCGYVVGRGVAAVLPWLDRLPVAAATFTLAVPYPLYILADQVLHASGVVAVVTAGLVIGAYGPTRLSPRNWNHLGVIWDQTAVLAGASVFLLAAVQVPDLLSSMHGADFVYLVITVLAALAARAIVMFGIFPMLVLAGLSRPVDNRYKLAIVWGGLRGAVTLVLALALADNQLLPVADRRFAASLAAAFVLVSLFVNGLTLRWLVARLGLTALSAQQLVLQRQAALLSAAEVDADVTEVATQFSLPDDLISLVRQTYQTEVTAGSSGPAIEDALTERERLSIGLVILAAKEHSLVPEYGSGVIATSNLDAMMRNTSLMIDAARQDGRLGYNRAAAAILDEPMALRVGRFFAHRLGVRRVLMNALADRFELMICRRAVLERLVEFNRKSLKPFVGERMAAVLDGILRARLDAVEKVIEDLGQKYGAEFAHALEQRLLLLFALARGSAIIESLKEDNIISAEIAASISIKLDKRHRSATQRPSPSLISLDDKINGRT